MKCIKCSKELPEGSVFCCFCGEKQKALCSSCGAELVCGALFCHKCGAKQGEEKKEQAKAPEMKIKSSVPEEHKDIHGFYNSAWLNFDVSENLVVFADGNGLYSATADGKLYRRSDYPIAVATDGVTVYAVEDDFSNERLVIKKYSDKLSLISEKNLGVAGNVCADGYQKIYTLTCDAYYQVSLRVWGNNPAEDIEIIKAELDFPIPEKIKVGQITWGGYTVQSVGNRLLVDNDVLYFEADAVNDEDDFSKLLIAYDISEREYEVIWHGTNSGKPLFFDFEKKIMWTKAKDSEAGKLPPNALVSRLIAPQAPMLYNTGVWSLDEERIRYFDGNKAYEAPSYYQFYAVDNSGRRSGNWNPTTHGMADKAIMWNGNIIMNLEDYDIYTSYPAEFECPDNSRRIKLENIKVD